VTTSLKHFEVKRLWHRDIDPSNIFINDKGNSRVGDFGFSRAMLDTTREPHILLERDILKLQRLNGYGMELLLVRGSSKS
jgi:serine/threonine protein kinase